jgi:hypothetical protein
MKRAFLSMFLGAAIFAAGPAYAAGADPANATAIQREQAQQHFLKGKDKFDRNDMKTALDEFRASLEIVASPNARLYVARTLREMGRLVEAYVEFGRTAADAKEHEREDGRYGKAAQAALAERDAIAPQIGFVQLSIKNSTDATTVVVAGSAIVRAGWGDPIPAKPGSVDIDITTPGGAPVHKTVTLHAGEKLSVDVDANAPAAVAIVDHGGGETSSSHADKPTWLLPAAIAGAGVGVVGMLFFTIAGVASNNTYSDLKTKCGAGPCPSSDAGEVSGGKTQQAIANTGLVFGLAGIAAGAAFFVWWVLPRSAAHTPSAAITFGPGSIGVAGKF